MGSAVSTPTATATTTNCGGGPSAADHATASDAIVKLFGNTLVGKSGEVETASALGGKTVGIYFSAHWCPPCRGFTPKLAETYKRFKEAGKEFEIVFVSSDKSAKEADEYYGEMPWLALPYDDRDRKTALSKKFKVSGIPTLVIVGEDGATITTDGRDEISSDPQGANFPWRPTPLSELLAGDFVGKDGAPVAAASLASKHLGLYFSAHWCPPCRGFTPQLATFYKDFTATRGSELEIVFVSSDRDEGAFKEYFGEMPWMALPFADRSRKEALSKAFGVNGIPALVILGPAGADGSRPIVSKNARGAVSADPTGADFPWAPKPFGDLSAGVECNGCDINEKPALILLMGGADDATKATLGASLEALAKEADVAAKATEDGEPEMLFFTAKSDGGVVGRIREMTGVKESAEPALLLMDIPDNGGYYVRTGGGAVDAAAIRDFAAKYKAGSLERQQLS